MVSRKDNYRKGSGTNIDLITQIPVPRNHRLETGPFGRINQIPIPEGRPPHLRSGAGIMAGEQISQGARHILIEQNPHYGVGLCRS
jgi:hypothetical protein